MHMRGPFVEGVKTCVVPSESSGTSGKFRLLSCGLSGSSISTTCWGGALALKYPLLGYRHFLLAPYLEFIYLISLVKYTLLGIPLLLHLNWPSLLGFIRLQ